MLLSSAAASTETTTGGVLATAEAVVLPIVVSLLLVVVALAVATLPIAGSGVLVSGGVPHEAATISGETNERRARGRRMAENPRAAADGSQERMMALAARAANLSMTNRRVRTGSGLRGGSDGRDAGSLVLDLVHAALTLEIHPALDGDLR